MNTKYFIYRALEATAFLLIIAFAAYGFYKFFI